MSSRSSSIVMNGPCSVDNKRTSPRPTSTSSPVSVTAVKHITKAAAETGVSLQRQQQQQQQQRNRRRVRFAAEGVRESFRYVPTLDEIPSDETDATWYSKEEYSEMRKEIKAVVRKMAKGLPLEAGVEEPRGLEHKTPQGLKSRQKNRFMSIDIVLDEQERQFEELADRDGSSVPCCRGSRNSTVYIAEIYRQSTAHCAAIAQQTARRDAEYVQKHVRDNADDDVHALLRRQPRSQRQRVTTTAARVVPAPGGGKEPSSTKAGLAELLAIQKSPVVCAAA